MMASARNLKRKQMEKLEELEKKARNFIKEIDQFKIEMQASEKETKISDNLWNCPICFTGYSSSRDPVSGSCGHTLCRSCAKSLRGYDCPICRSYFSFYKPVKNYQLFDVLKELGALESNAREEPAVPNGEGAAVVINHQEEGLPLADNAGRRQEAAAAEAEEEDDTDSATRELLRLRAEVAHLLRVTPPSEVLGSLGFDHMWFLVVTHHLHGRYPRLAEQVLRNLPIRAPYHFSLRIVAEAMLNWRIDHRMAGQDLSPEFSARSQDWPTANSRTQILWQWRNVEITEQCRRRLQLIHDFAKPYKPDFNGIYPGGMRNQTRSQALLAISQFFDDRKESMVVEAGYTPLWYRPPARAT